MPRKDLSFEQIASKLRQVEVIGIVVGESVERCSRQWSQMDHPVTFPNGRDGSRTANQAVSVRRTGRAVCSGCLS